jgi:hypothetical protein
LLCFLYRKEKRLSSTSFFRTNPIRFLSSTPEGETSSNQSLGVLRSLRCSILMVSSMDKAVPLSVETDINPRLLFLSTVLVIGNKITFASHTKQDAARSEVDALVAPEL